MWIYRYEDNLSQASLRTARTTSLITRLIFLRKQKINNMCEQGGTTKSFSDTLAKIYGRIFQTFKKFFLTSTCFVKL